MFEQAKLQLDYGVHHIKCMQKCLDAYLEEQSFNIRTNHNTETFDLNLWLQIVETEVWDEIPLHAGACIQAIRTSLDYAISEVMNAAKGTDTRTSFPVHKDNTQILGDTSLRKIREVNSGLADVIANDIKPTKSDNYAIWAVNRLANTNKHRNLILTKQVQTLNLDVLPMIGGVKPVNKEMTTPRQVTENEFHWHLSNVKQYTQPQADIKVTVTEPEVVEAWQRQPPPDITSLLNYFGSSASDAIRTMEEFLTSA